MSSHTRNIFINEVLNGNPQSCYEFQTTYLGITVGDYQHQARNSQVTEKSQLDIPKCICNLEFMFYNYSNILLKTTKER